MPGKQIKFKLRAEEYELLIKCLCFASEQGGFDKIVLSMLLNKLGEQYEANVKSK